MSFDNQNAAEPAKRISAGELYRAAFERLKHNKPDRLPQGTPVSQNNIAKEAGCDPSALRKTRFPLLIAEIQAYVEAHADERPPSARQVSLQARKRNRDHRERIKKVTQQRDHLSSLLSEADTTILELYGRITELEGKLPTSNVLPIDPKGRKTLGSGSSSK